MPKNKITFRVMRGAEAQAWPTAMLESYLADLKTAKGQGRNLMTEKYAWMMAVTAPAEYWQLAPHLPVLSESKKQLIAAICQIILHWEAALAPPG